jgi:hypothetical protein
MAIQKRKRDKKLKQKEEKLKQETEEQKREGEKKSEPKWPLIGIKR